MKFIKQWMMDRLFSELRKLPFKQKRTVTLDLEEILKANIDKGLTVWFEPVGDKSKLRKLRGITFQNN